MFRKIFTALFLGGTFFVNATQKIVRIKTINHLEPVALAAAPTGSHFVACMIDGSVRIMDASKQQTVKLMDGKHPVQPTAVAYSPNGEYIASGDDQGRVWLWNAKTGKKIKEFNRMEGHTKGIQWISFDSSSKIFATTGKDDFVILWNVHGSNPIKKLPGQGANLYSANFIKNLLVMGTEKNGLRFYRKEDCGLIKSATCHKLNGACCCIDTVDVSGNGNKAISGGRDGKATIWNVAAKSPTVTLHGHADWVTQSALSPNGNLAATVSNDRKLIVWNTSNGQKIAEFPDADAQSPLVFTRNGKYLITKNAMFALNFYQIN